MSRGQGRSRERGEREREREGERERERESQAGSAPLVWSQMRGWIPLNHEITT